MPPKQKQKAEDANSEDRLTRIAVISEDRCKPKKCMQECKKSCPVVKIGAAWAAVGLGRRRLRGGCEAAAVASRTLKASSVSR